MNYLKYIIFFVLSVLCFGSCEKSNRFKIDTNENRINVSVQRFDQDFLHLDTADIASEITKLHDKYPEFYPLFIENILDRDLNELDSICMDIQNFLRDSTFLKVNQDVLSVFENIENIEKTLSESYTYIHHYFPEISLPEICFYVSGFYQSVILSRGIIAIGSDLYLGADYPMYKDIGYQYLIQNMKPENIPVDIVSAILFSNFSFSGEHYRLIDNMIYQGKLHYLISVFMPSETKENIMAYTQAQWDWSEKYERDIWRAIIDKKDLFSSDNQLIRKYMNDAPFTSPISQDSPGRLGAWIGWRIVESYMNNNQEIGLKELMLENNAQKILENSGYRQ